MELNSSWVNYSVFPSTSNFSGLFLAVNWDIYFLLIYYISSLNLVKRSNSLQSLIIFILFTDVNLSLLNISSFSIMLEDSKSSFCSIYDIKFSFSFVTRDFGNLFSFLYLAFITLGFLLLFQLDSFDRYFLCLDFLDCYRLFKSSSRFKSYLNCFLSISFSISSLMDSIFLKLGQIWQQ